MSNEIEAELARLEAEQAAGLHDVDFIVDPREMAQPATSPLLTDHTWVNIDKDGTVGWHRCTVCGDRHHFPGNAIEEPKWLTACHDIVRGKAAIAVQKINTLLHGLDADTPAIRSLVKANLPLVKTSKAYEPKA